MKENKLPEFGSIEKLVEFFDTHDMGEYDLPEVQFDVSTRKPMFLVSVDKDLMKKLSEMAKAQHTSTEKLVNTWLEEKVARAA
ncbi:MAG: CopG family antitoxin [Blastocatellia bacterium]